MNKKIKLKKRPEIISMPDIPEPTSYALTKNFFIDYKKITIKVLKMFNKKDKKSLNNFFKKDKLHHDQPHQKYFGPF